MYEFMLIYIIHIYNERFFVYVYNIHNVIYIYSIIYIPLNMKDKYSLKILLYILYINKYLSIQILTSICQFKYLQVYICQFKYLRVFVHLNIYK